MIAEVGRSVKAVAQCRCPETGGQVGTLLDVAKAGPRTQPPGEDLRGRLIDAAVRVLARDGFAHASARAIAQEAGTVNGSIFYYFGSMDGLLAATARALAERGIARIGDGLGGDRAHLEWPARLSAVMRAEAEGEDGQAVMELFVGARTSPALAAEVRAAIDQAIDYAIAEMQRVLGGSPITHLIPVDLIAELAAAAFLGIEVLAQNGREIDLDRLATTLAAGVQLVTGSASRP
jgi:AcrR family transcriptional regulator